MYTVINQFIANIWLPLTIWSIIAVGYWFYQQLVNKYDKVQSNHRLLVNVIIWMLPISVFFQFLTLKLLSSIQHLSALPTILDINAKIQSILIDSSSTPLSSNLNASTIIAFIWFIGCTMGLTKMLLSWIIIQNKLKDMPIMSWKRLLKTNLSEDLFERFGFLLSSTKVRISEDAVSPCVVNASSPTIILPKQILTNPTLMKIALFHELIHIKNKDLSHSLLNQLIRIMFWFHPIIHLYTSWASRNRELQCDLEVIGIGEINKAEYANSLVLVSREYTPFSLVCMAAKVSQLKLRIQDISSLSISDFNQTKHKPISLLSATIPVLLTLLLILNPKNTLTTNALEVSSSATKSTVNGAELPQIIGGISEVFKHIKYPKEAKLNGIEGRVEIEFIVDSYGNPKNAQILRGIGYGCDEEALNAILKTKFVPASFNGKAFETKYTIPIVFRLQE